MVAHRHRVTVVEPLHVANDLCQDSAEAIADGNDADAIELRGLDVQQVIDASLCV